MPTSPSLLLRVFAGAIFLSAALLFAVQPMFTKMVLPRLGGTPSVWSVAMVFFQAVLLAGYAYAHALTKYFPGKRSITIHLAVMAVACLFLPLSIATWWGRPPADATAALWLLGLFAVSIGVPFFALSANGPLLQAWFARTDHPSAANPYFLYAASNVGSFLALISYPFIVEPFTTLGTQRWAWTVLRSSVPFAKAQVECFEFADAGAGTRIRWTLALDPRLIARLGGPFATRAIRRLLTRATTNLDARLAGAVVR